MKIYLVLERWEWSFIAAFSTRKKAEAFVKNEYDLLNLPGYDPDDKPPPDFEYVIEEVRLDPPLRIKLT